MKQHFKSFLNRLAGFLGAKLLLAWMGTLDYRCDRDSEARDPALCAAEQQYIYLVWHEHVLCPLYLRSRCRISTLASRHRDAEILSELLRRLNVKVVRGSTTRGGAVALRALMEITQTYHCVITPDGPQGPRRTVAQGAIYLAMRLGIPLVPLGVGYQRPWRLPTWDRFAIPKPFSRCRIVLGEPIRVPPDLDREQLAAMLSQVDEAFQKATAQAEHWAETGERHAGEVPMRQLRAARQIVRVDAAQKEGPRPSSTPAKAFARNG